MPLRSYSDTSPLRNLPAIERQRAEETSSQFTGNALRTISNQTKAIVFLFLCSCSKLVCKTF